MSIDILPGAKADIAALRKKDLAAFAVLMVVIQEASADPALVAKLTGFGDVFFGKLRVNVKPWVAARRAKKNLYRFRMLDTPATKYRVIYGYDWSSRRIGILAIIDRDDKETFDYELDGALADRIIADWRVATDGRDT